VRKKLSPELREQIRRDNEFGGAARANMQRIIDEHEERRRRRAEEAARRPRWLRFLRRAA
jgi:hypothetical protein